jgi:polyisoprenoid-binding protein YceI
MTYQETEHLSGLPPSGRYVLEPARSTVRFRTRHLFGLGGVEGTVTVSSGEIVVAAPPERSTVNATLDAASFSTGHTKRDSDVRSARFLHADEYPLITFEASGASRSDGGWILSGRLAVRGAVQPVQLRVTSLEVSDGELHARATTRLDRYAFGLTKAKGMAARHREVELTLAAPHEVPRHVAEG